MKYLVTAHPDDEILIAIYTDITSFDKIVIVFSDREIEGFGDRRRSAIANHPLKDKIIMLNLRESGYNRDVSKYDDLVENYFDLCDWLKENIKDDDEIITHNAWGEYGHSDHKMVHEAVFDTVNCPVNKKDPKLYREIKRCYKQQGVWTWYIGTTPDQTII